MRSPLDLLDALASRLEIIALATILLVPVVAVGAAVIAGVRGELSRTTWFGDVAAHLALAMALSVATVMFTSLVVDPVVHRRRARAAARRREAALAAARGGSRALHDTQ